MEYRREMGAMLLSRIRDWLKGRNDLEVVILPEELRKDPEARKKALKDASIVLLCLPDDAAKDAAAWLADSPVRILDASTAHRVSDGWVYGLPELVPGQRERIANAHCRSQASAGYRIDGFAIGFLAASPLVPGASIFPARSSVALFPPISGRLAQFWLRLGASRRVGI